MDSVISCAVHGATSGNVALSAGPQLDAALLEAPRGRASRVRASVNAILSIGPFEDRAVLACRRSLLVANAAAFCDALADDLDTHGTPASGLAWQLWSCLILQDALLRRRDRNVEASAAGFLMSVALELADRLVDALEARA